MSDASAFEPDDDGGEDDQCAVIECAFFEARGQPTPLFEPTDAALHDVAPRVDRWVKVEGTSWSSRSLGTLVASLGNGARDLALSQQAAPARVAVAVALVSDEVVWTRPWSPASAGAWDPDADAAQD